MAFKYRRPSEAAVRQDSTQSGGAFASIFVDGHDEFKPKKGSTYTIRIAPATWGTDDNPPKSYAHEVMVNYGVGPDGEGFISRTWAGFDDDPVLEMHDRLRQFGDEYADLLKEQKAKKRRPMYVLVQGEEDLGWRPWAPGWTVQRDIAKASVSKRKKTVKYIDDPEEGYWVTFSRESGGYGDYAIDEVDDEPSPISEDPKRQKELLDWLVENPLPDQYKIYSYDEIKRRCDGQEAAATADGDTGDAPEDEPDEIPRTRASARRRPAAEDPEPEDDFGGFDPPEPIDDPEESLDEEPDFHEAPIEEDAPKRRVASKRKPGIRRKAAT